MITNGLILLLPIIYILNFSQRFPTNGTYIPLATNENYISQPIINNQVQTETYKNNEVTPAPETTAENFDSTQLDKSEIDQVPIETETAKEIYSEFSNAIINEDQDKLSSLLDDNLEFWHSKVSLSKQDVFDDINSYFKKWRALDVQILSFESDGENQFRYEILYQIEKRNDLSENFKYNISGVIKLNNENKIIGVKDLTTKKNSD